MITSGGGNCSAGEACRKMKIGEFDVIADEIKEA
jgi:hypothetical protein